MLDLVDVPRLQALAGEFPGNIEVSNPVQLYRIEYWTAFKGAAVRASGLMIVPVAREKEAKGVVMYLHGTNATRRFAPSQAERVDGDQEAAVFGGNGFVALLPDYIGQGESTAVHPDMIVQPQVDASRDLLVAARAATSHLGVRTRPSLFLMGFSQGGQVAAGLHRELERNSVRGYRLRGTVGIAGPYNLRDSSLPKALESGCVQCMGYLAWAAQANAEYYGHDLAGVFKPAFRELVPALFDGTKTVEQIGGALPDDPDTIFDPQFLAMMRGAKDGWFPQALDQNNTHDWVPKRPVRLYHGSEDVDVPLASSQAFHNFARNRGGKVSLEEMSGADHQESAARAYAPALRWFEDLARKTG